MNWCMGNVCHNQKGEGVLLWKWKTSLLMVQYGPLKAWIEVTSDPPQRNSTLLTLNLNKYRLEKCKELNSILRKFYWNYNYFPPLYLNILSWKLPKKISLF
jgi:hypothetical protein